MDINIDADEFFKIYEGSDHAANLTLQNHKEIETHQDFLETFFYFFQDGASSERAVSNGSLVLDIQEQIEAYQLKNYKEVGGHAPRFAERIRSEGCQAFFPGQFSDYTVQHMDNLGVKVHNCESNPETTEQEDVHLCILYQEGHTYFEHKATRSNRFYLITDPKGSKLSYIEDYHKTGKIFLN